MLDIAILMWKITPYRICVSFIYTKVLFKLFTFVEIETLYIFVTIYSIDPQNLGAIPYSA